MALRHWLMKCEPDAYTIEDLQRDGRTGWEGVRNFQARNFLRDEMQVGDPVLFYASNAEPSGVTGLARIARAGHPDPTAFTPGHAYFDPRSRRESPTWFQVEIEFVERFPGTVSLATLKATPALAGMGVVRRGDRLSVQPVTAAEFRAVTKLGRRAARG